MRRFSNLLPDQENFASARSRHFRGRLLEARRKPRYNAVGGHHIEDVQTLDRGGRMSCVDCLCRFPSFTLPATSSIPA